MRATRRACGLIAIASVLALLPTAAAFGQVDDAPEGHRVAMAVPEFGGAWWTGEDGDTLHIWLTENTPSNLERAHEALVRFGGSQFHADDIVGHAARYSWLTLEDWYGSMDVGAIPGVFLIDISERHNRLWVGVERADVRPQVEARLTERGIPLEAVRIVVEQPPVLLPGQTRSGWPWIGSLMVVLGFGSAVAFFAISRRRRRAAGGISDEPGRTASRERTEIEV